LSPTANPAGIWEGIAQVKSDGCHAGSLFFHLRPAFRRSKQGACMDAVYVLLGLAFFVISYALVELITRL
jgi:hypothetical protein